MREINEELEDLMNKTAEDLQKGDPVPLLADLRQRILECHQIEKEAFQLLSNALGS